MWGRVYINLINPGDVLLAQGYPLVDKTELESSRVTTRDFYPMKYYNKKPAV